MQKKPQDNSKACPAAFVQDSTLVAVIEMSLSSWLVAGMIPGVSRDPLKKIDPNPDELLKLLHRWRDEAIKAGKRSTGLQSLMKLDAIVSGLPGGFGNATSTPTSSIPPVLAVSREHRRAKTDRIDTAMLKRGFLGWLRGEPGHCSMAVVPTIEEEDAKRPCRERDRVGL